MKKIKKLLKKLNNRGSSIIMVIVSLAFIGIIVAALLGVAGLTYKLKLQYMNDRDNFYYVEQAMNEIYAGVGSQTVSDMQKAYVYTVENMVYYSTDIDDYTTLSNVQANKLFKDKFLEFLGANDFFNQAQIADQLEKLITNESVKLDADKLVLNKTTDGIELKNITLTRTQDYKNSAANGTYTQTLSADIFIGKPDFTVNFSNSTATYDNIFDYAMVADMGIEVKQPATPLSISGNIYAASDYYNKNYDAANFGASVEEDDRILQSEVAHEVIEYDEEGNEVKKNELFGYVHGSVTSKTYTPETGSTPAINNGFYNKYEHLYKAGEDVKLTAIAYNGVSERSYNSGLFIDGTTVSVNASNVIVPGTIAVMNMGELSIFGKSGESASEAEVWADNMVLDGYSKKTIKKEGTKEEVETTGSKAILRANLFIKDDTEINASGAQFNLMGSYYGYGDSTEKDERTFIGTVDPTKFMVPVYDEDGNLVKDSEGNAVFENRYHYNSSAIIVNGINSKLDLSKTKKIFLAGRAYLELSKKVNNDDSTIDDPKDNKNPAGEKDQIDVVTNTYEFNPSYEVGENPNKKTVYIRDYKTGESLSLKSNQVLYIPIITNAEPKFNETDLTYVAELPVAFEDSFFDDYFPAGDVYCIREYVSNREYFYYDFYTAYNKLNATAKARFASAENMAAQFVMDYRDYYNELIEAQEGDGLTEIEETRLSKMVDIGNYEDFDFTKGEIRLPNTNKNSAQAATIYSSGVLTTKTDTEFKMTLADEAEDANNLLSTYDANISGDTLTDEALSKMGIIQTAFSLSNDLEREYVYMKWNLGHYENASDADKVYINSFVDSNEFSEADITPINRFLYMDKITTDFSIMPKKNASDGDGDHTLILAGGEYRVWVSNEDVTITKEIGALSGEVSGMVITKGDVFFDKDVTSFKGLIIAGGKVYVDGAVAQIYADKATCKAILNECMVSSDQNAKDLLSLFRGYEEESKKDPEDNSTDAKKIDTIDYTDVVSINNWIKNVE